MANVLSPAEQLCLSCGMCCDGTLHNWTYLQPEELARASAAGLEVFQPPRRQARHDPRPGFRQPCRALRGLECQIYRERPQACQDYICPVLQRLNDGELSLQAAQEIVQQARQLIRLLRTEMPFPAEVLSLEWQVRLNWPAHKPLPADVEPIFVALAGLLRREWKMKWRRQRPKRQRRGTGRL
jgi:hypothetical protein